MLIHKIFWHVKAFVGVAFLYDEKIAKKSLKTKIQNVWQVASFFVTSHFDITQQNVGFVLLLWNWYLLKILFDFVKSFFRYGSLIVLRKKSHILVSCFLKRKALLVQQPVQYSGNFFVYSCRTQKELFIRKHFWISFNFPCTLTKSKSPLHLQK